jgi:hypothetical protein
MAKIVGAIKLVEAKFVLSTSCKSHVQIESLLKKLLARLLMGSNLRLQPDKPRRDEICRVSLYLFNSLDG